MKGRWVHVVSKDTEWIRISGVGIVRIELCECPEKEDAMRHRNKQSKDRFLKRRPGTFVDMIVPTANRILVEWISTNELSPRLEISISIFGRGAGSPSNRRQLRNITLDLASTTWPWDSRYWAKFGFSSRSIDNKNSLTVK
jgi:hypothetical protein